MRAARALTTGGISGMNRSTSSTLAFTSSSDWQSSISEMLVGLLRFLELDGDLEEVFALEIELRRQANEICNRNQAVSLGDVNDVNDEAIDLSSIWR